MIITFSVELFSILDTFSFLFLYFLVVILFEKCNISGVFLLKKCLHGLEPGLRRGMDVY